MDELFKQVLAQSPLAGVLLFCLWAVYRDLRDRMEKADAERAILIAALIDNTRRTKLIEKETTGDTTPTLPKPPSV